MIATGMDRTIRIGIDGSFLSGQRRGIGHYAFSLLKALDRLLPQARFYLYCPVDMELPVESDRWQLRTAAGWLNRSPITWLKTVGSHLCRQDRLDVFWGTYCFLPHLPPSTRAIASLHDFAYQVIPGNMPFAHDLAFRLFLKADMARADALVANSHATNQRLREMYGHSATVISPSVSDRFCPQSETAIQACLQRHGIRAPYLLNVATWDPRKNLDMLVHAFVEMKARSSLPEAFTLVLVGKKEWSYQGVDDLVAQRQDIRWLGYVPGEDLPALYAGAELFVFPSLYEGFGMPVLEARACGTRAVTTDSPELREAGGEDSIYVRLTRDDLAQGILRGLDGHLPSPKPPRVSSWQEQGKRLADLMLGLHGI